ncbi:MAG: hypothetical protein Q9185_005411 [Variospora sp. 1 TL-2023]
MPTPMGLRKSVKAPKRYEDEIAERGQLLPSPPVNSHPPITTRPKAYRGPVIEYNPNLPPAAFPTLDPRQPTPAPGYQQQMDRHIPSNPRRRNGNPTPSPPYRPPPSNFSHRDLNHSFPLRKTSSQSSYGIMAGIGQASRSHHMDNGIGNPIWEGNMAIMEKLSKRTDEDWVMAEMETSDEGESSSQQTKPKGAKPNGKAASSAPPPLWDDIPLSLRVEMVYAAAGDDVNAEKAFLKLRLDPKQRDVMMEQLSQYNEREDAEDARIAAHQALMMEALLTGNKKYSSSEAFNTVASVHLYKDMDRDDKFATRREVYDAEAYMLSLGLDASFLDSWGHRDGVVTDSAEQPLTTTGSNDELDAKHPQSDSFGEILGDILGAQEDTTEPATTNITHWDPFTPTSQDHDQQSTDSDKASFKSNVPAITGPRKPSYATSRRTTGDVIEVDAGVQEMSPPSSSIKIWPSSMTQITPDISAYPQTPQASAVQYPLSGEASRSRPWPRTPPTPSLVKNSFLQDGESDHEPKHKKHRMSSSGKQPLLQTTAGLIPSSGNGTRSGTEVGEVVPTVRVSPKHSAVALVDREASVSTDAAVEADSSSAPTDQENSTIVVDIPREFTPAAEQEQGTSEPSDAGTKVAPMKGKSGRGRGRPKTRVG